MQKARASLEFIYCSENLFSKQDICDIFNFSINQVSYIINQLRLIKPFYMEVGKGSFYTWNNLKEFSIVKKLIDSGIKIAELKRVKTKLQSIDYSLDFTDKSVIFAYGELFFIEELTQLTNLHKGEKTLLATIVLSELENEIDDKASKVIALTTYKHKKYFKPDKEILAKFA